MWLSGSIHTLSKYLLNAQHVPGVTRFKMHTFLDFILSTGSENLVSSSPPCSTPPGSQSVLVSPSVSPSQSTFYP